MRTLFGLKESKVKGKGYMFFDIPNVEHIKVAISKYDTNFITLAGYDDRGLWFRLGDREDLKPTELKDFGLTSCRSADKQQQENFIKKVIKIFG